MIVKAVFTLANKILFRERADGIPGVIDTETGEFNAFFIEKIAKIRIAIDEKPVSETVRGIHTESAYSTTHRFDRFSILTTEDVDGLIRKSATKSCSLDPCPTSIVKEYKQDLLPLMTDIKERITVWG